MCQLNVLLARNLPKVNICQKTQIDLTNYYNSGTINTVGFQTKVLSINAK